MPSNIGATEHHQFYGHAPSGAVATLANDLSGNADFTAGATYHIHSSSFSYGAPYTIMVEGSCRFGSNPAGYVFARYSGTTSQGIRYNGSTGLQLVVNNAVAQTLTVPGSGSDTLTIAWSMDDDPVSGNMRSQVRVWASDGSLLDGVDWTHTDPGSSGDDIIFGAQVTAGTNSAQWELYGAGVLLHGIEGLQVYRDRLSAAAAPTLTGDAPIEVPMPDWSSNFGAQDRSAGPTHWIAGGAIAQNQLLLASPLVNKLWADPDPTSWNNVASAEWWTLSPDGDSYLGLPFTFKRPVPKTVNYVKARVFIAAGATGGAGNNVTVDATVWSHNRNPGVVDETPLVGYSDTQSFGPVNDTAASNEGRWLEFDPIRISRSENQLWTWLSLSIDFTLAEGSEQNFTVRAITIEPISDTDSDAVSGIGFG